jgi:2,3-bisphosphoglycerate-dependent phosphoglycerate mutase
MHLEHISENDIPELNIPTGAPRLYTFDGALGVTSARYLGDAEAVAAAAAAVAAQAGGH